MIQISGMVKARRAFVVKPHTLSSQIAKTTSLANQMTANQYPIPMFVAEKNQSISRTVCEKSPGYQSLTMMQ